VCEPVETFQLEIPVGALPVVTVTLARLAGLVTGTAADAAAAALTLTGTIPTRNVQPLLAQLPEQTSGEAVFTSEVTHYTPVTGPAPERPRIGPNPLDRETWFRARFNALIIVALIPLALRGVAYQPRSAQALLRRNLLVYGVGGVIVPFIGIKLIDICLTGLGLS
jgi:hypothetical protein